MLLGMPKAITMAAFMSAFCIAPASPAEKQQAPTWTQIKRIDDAVIRIGRVPLGGHQEETAPADQRGPESINAEPSEAPQPGVAKEDLVGHERRLVTYTVKDHQ